MTIKNNLTQYIRHGKITIKNQVFSLLVICSFLGHMGCATPGPKIIDLAYNKHHSPTQSGKVGIAQFKDKRQKKGQGVVGFRILTDSSQETYRVRGKNLGTTLTELTRVYLEKTGFVVTPIPPWLPSLDAIPQTKGVAHILSADINTFECKAQKKGALTDMVLRIDLTFYLGELNPPRLSTIPVSLTLERTELIFTPEKLAQFINQALEEIIERAFPFE